MLMQDFEFKEIYIDRESIPKSCGFEKILFGGKIVLVGKTLETVFLLTQTTLKLASNFQGSQNLLPQIVNLILEKFQ